MVGETTCGRAVVDGGELYFERRGDGPPVVLVHGGFSDLSFWDLQVDALAARHSVIRYDLRGYGRSSMPTGPYGHHRDLLALLDHLGLERAALVGLSYGGGIVLDAAVTAPQRCSAVVAVDAGPLVGYRWVGGHPAGPAMRAFRDGGLDAARAVFLTLPMFQQAAARPHAMAVLRPMVDAYAGWVFLNADPIEVPQPPTIERLGDITAPTLAMVGEHDLADFHHIAEIVADQVPHGRSLVLPGCGHVPAVEEPNLFNTELLAFLDTAHA